MPRALTVLLALALTLIPAPAGAADLEVSFEVIRVTPTSATIRATISGADGPLTVTARVDDYRGKPGPAVQGLRVQAVERVAEYRGTPQYETKRVPITEKLTTIEAEVEAMRKAPALKGEQRQLQEEAINGKEDELAALYAQADLGAAFIEEEIVTAHRYDLRYRERLVPVAATNEEAVLVLPAQSWAEPPPATLIAEDELKLDETAVNWGDGVRVYEYTVQTDSLSGSTSGILVLTINGRDYYDDTNSSWWDEEWPYRMKLTIDNSASTEDLIDFPLMVKLTPERFDYSFAQVDGDDIRFVDADGTALDYECDTWTLGGNSWFWVRVPHIPAGDTTDYIWMYWGTPTVGNGENPHGVWPTDIWTAVYHMNDKPGDSTKILDSTVNANHGTKGPGAAAPTEVAGVAGKAQEFVAGTVTTPGDTGDYITVADSDSLDFTIATIMALVTLPASQTSIYAGIVGKRANDANQWKLYHHGQAGYVNFVDSYNGQSRPVGSCLSETALVHITSSGATAIAYKNGVPVGTSLAMAGLAPNAHLLNIGRAVNRGEGSSAFRYLDGLLHELRLASVALSGEWIEADYRSMWDAMLTYGDAEGPVAPVGPVDVVSDWTAAVLLILLTFIALKERHVMTYTAAFLFLVMYGWTLGTANLGLTICVLLFAGYMLYHVSLSLLRRA